MRLEDTPEMRAIAIRFWPKVDKCGPIQPHCPDLGPCWVWTASFGTGGYGQIGDTHRKPIGAHRVSWMLAYGPIPAGLQVLHRCDNRRCVQPAHLWLGTMSENIKDMYAKARGNAPLPPARKGQEHGLAKLTDDQVRDIRRLYAAGDVSQRVLAVQYGVGTMTVNEIVRGLRWQHLL